MTVCLLMHFCLLELRTLQAQRELWKAKYGVGEYAGKKASFEISSGSATTTITPSDVNLTPPPQQASNTSSLLEVLRDAATEGITQISKAVATGLTDTNADHPRASKKKGHLTLHVGPSKTATTTLQTDLTEAFDAGWLDGGTEEDRAYFHYAGRYYRPYISNITGNLVINRSESPLLSVMRTMREDGDCADFRRALDDLYEEEKERVAKVSMDADDNGESAFFLNVIVSDEAFGNMWLDASDYEAIRDAVGDEWHVTVVVGFRRFQEWIVSSKFQRDRTDKLSAMGKEYWPSAGGRALLPMFPDTLRDWRHWYHYTDSIVETVGTTFPVRILNLHSPDESSILTQFLCEILESAEVACAHSRERDFLAEETVMNAQEAATVPSLYYDAIATAAAEAGFIDESAFKRSEVREAARVYQEETLGLSSQDLPQVCPSRAQLDELFELSLEMEQAYMPSLFSDDDDSDSLNRLDEFEAKVAENSYCWVDTTAILLDSNWQQLLAPFATTD